MKPFVSYFHRTSSKPKKTKGYPVSLSVKLGKKTIPYVIGLNLNVEEYQKAHSKNREGKAFTHFIQISTAHARMKAIAELMEPFIFKAFAYIIKNAKKEYKEIFLDKDFNFDPHIIAAKYLEQYINSYPGTIIPTLLSSPNASYNERALAPLNTYAGNVTSSLSLVPPTTESAMVLHAKPFTNGMHTATKAIIIDPNGNEMGNNGGPKNIQINNFYITNTGGGDNNGQLALPSATSKYNPDANIFPWIINSMDKKNGTGTGTGYKNAIQKLFIYATISKRITKVENQNHLKFKSTDKDFLENYEKWLFREGISWTFQEEEEKGEDKLSNKTWTFEKGKILKKGEEWIPGEKKKGEEEDDTLEGMKRNSIKTYLSYIKSGFALAVEEGIIIPKENPFNKRRYILPKGEKQDRSLTNEEWRAILKKKPSFLAKSYAGHRPVSEAEMLAIIVLCYCLSGINLVDIAMMRCYQIQKFILDFTRRKMIRKKGLGEVTLTLSQRVQAIFARWGTPINQKTGSITAKNSNDFVFPILTPVFPRKKWDEMSELEKKTWEKDNEIYEKLTKKDKLKVDPPLYPIKKISQMTEDEKQAWEREEYDEYRKQIAAYGGRVNRFIQEILEEAGFDPTGITFYSIRHTFTNDAREQGIEIDEVMKLLGQSSYEAFSHYNNRRRKATIIKVDNMIDNFTEKPLPKVTKIKNFTKKTIPKNRTKKKQLRKKAA